MTNTQAASEKILERVQQLLNIAEHPNTGVHEADVAMRQAQSLITKHAIDEAILRMGQTTEQRRAPEKREIKLAEGGSGRYIHALRTILSRIADVNRCSLALDYTKAEVYGASEDVAWVEMLYMSVYFQLMSKINPKWDITKTYDENVYNFKVAGFKWSEIDAKSRENDGPDARVWEKNIGVVNSETGLPYYSKEARNIVPEERPNSGMSWARWEEPTNKISGSMITAYRRHAKLIGDTEPVATQSHDVYKLSFVEGFKGELLARLRRMEKDAEDEMDTIPGAALALTSMKEDIKAMFYDEHPELDPEVIRERNERARQERAEMLAAMTPKQQYDFLEKEERQSRRAAKSIRYYNPETSAMGRGSAAAKDIDLTRKAGSAEAAQTRKEIG